MAKHRDDPAGAVRRWSGLSDEYETLIWLGAPKKNDRSVLSAKIKGHMSFNYVIEYPCTQACWPMDEDF